MEVQIFLISIFAVVCLSQGNLLERDNAKKLNFVATNVVDGITTVRIARDGILGMESFVQGISERGLFLREATDGNRLVRLFFSDADTLITCDVLEDDPEEMSRFLTHFLLRHTLHQSDFEQKSLLHHLGRSGNFSWSMGSEEYFEEHPQFLSLNDLAGMTSYCKEFHREEKVKVKTLRERNLEKEKNGKVREKREGSLIYPGTKWCGKGNVGNSYEDLGDSRGADKCCRTHDMCPYWIASGTTKYGIYNFRITTLCHCDCDERFRTCLKYQGNPVADNLGDIFFNRLATKCFVFKPKRVCAKKSFWGRCTEYKNELQAEVLEPLEY